VPTDSFFHYQHDKLFCEGVSLSQLAEAYGSPLFVTSRASILNQYQRFEEAFAALDHLTCYSVKANFNLAIIKTLVEAGSGLDVNSGGELFRALKAGADPARMIMAGVGKTPEEIEYAINTGLLMIKAESHSELRQINAIGQKLNTVASVGIRINPNVMAETHPYITTGDSEEKFGIDEVLSEETFSLIKTLKNIRLVGLDMHIGSQIFDTVPYYEATLKLLGVKNIAESMGFDIEHIDIGGGFPITYKDEKEATPVEEFAQKLVPILKNTGAKIIFEPGRFIVGNSTVLCSKVLYRKENYKHKIFLIVDGAITELIRPSLYQAHHDILPVKRSETVITADVVGPVCETGDFFARDRQIQDCQEGDLLAILSSGAYGSVMSSNYNARRRPAEVLVDGENVKLIRRRDTYEQMIQNEI
jgi:diaminopimelate decarboxylase